jgi:hypothetical protein
LAESAAWHELVEEITKQLLPFEDAREKNMAEG